LLPADTAAKQENKIKALELQWIYGGVNVNITSLPYQFDTGNGGSTFDLTNHGIVREAMDVHAA
jgi:hypothetical protein